MSLRGRLLAGMVALVVVGLAVAAVATYAEQRSFLQGRLDQQVNAARFPVFTLLDARRGARLLHFAPRPGVRRFPGQPHGPNDLPPGTFGELVNASGAVVGRPVQLTYTGSRVGTPRPPAHFPVSPLG